MSYMLFNCLINIAVGIAYNIGLSGHASCELTWISTDSEHAFRQNKIAHPNEMANWHEHSVTYRINEHGFRGDMLPGSAMFLGCSHTFCTGLPENAAWPWIVSAELGLPCTNLGVNGGSNDTAFRLAHHWVPKLRPKILFWLQTYKERLEILAYDDIHNYSTQNESPFGSPTDKDVFYQNWISTDENFFLNFEKNLRGIQSICDEVSVPLVRLDVDDDLQYLDKARDLSHHGVLSNRAFAAIVLSKINQ